MRWIKRKKWHRILAWILCAGILSQSIPVYAIESEKPSKTVSDLDERILDENIDSVMENINAEAEETISSEEQKNKSKEEKKENQEIRQDVQREEKPQKEDAIRENAEIKTDGCNVYQNGIIKIYHLKQLRAIGSGQPVKTTDDKENTFGTGHEITENGTVITYSKNAQYQLMNDIELDTQNLWSLPEGFTGKFISEPVNESARLYDQEHDSIYIYHNYQLLTIASEKSEEEPVMSKDMVAAEFGIGQLLYKNGQPADNSMEAAQDYLTYSKEHRYVLSKNFTEQMPELKAEKIKEEATAQVDEGQLGGRDYLGQVYAKVEGESKPYILIGNEWQLRAIGQDADPKKNGNQYIQVTPMLYVKSKVDLPWPWDDKITYTPYYPGDADFNLKEGAAFGENGIEQKEFIYFSDENTNKTDGLMNIEYDKEGLVGELLGPLGELLGDILHALLGPLFDIPILGDILSGLIGERTDDIVIVDKEFNETNAQSYLSLSQASDELKSLKYSPDANYIIFRDIDLSSGSFSNGEDEDWKPIHLSGKIEGRKNMVEGNVPTISNIHVNQEGKLDFQKDSGIGFFGTISNELKKSGDAGFESAGKAGVKNLHLDQVTVNNSSTEVDNNPDSLVEGLLDLLGGLLGGILDLISGILEGVVPVIGDLKLGDVIKDLLALKQTSPDMFATGSFAGRIVGDVSVENCTVTNASVTNAKGMTGGFVGYTSGEATYFLGGVTGGIVELLSTLLNIIPAVGLGDLITVLLKNDVPLGNLFLNGYYKPVIQNSSVSLATGTIGITGTEENPIHYNGGFVGSQTGTDMSNCSVIGLNNVVADIGAGGFAGIEKDAQVQGLLSDVGAEIKTFDIRSTQTNCRVEGSDLSVTATDSYAGGFNGVMANSSNTGSNVTGVKLIKANKYAGGFSGRATLGYGMAVGSQDEQNHTLLQSVSKLLAELLASEKEEELGVLLSLSGAQPSEIKGSSVSGTNFCVQATTDYAGGLIGQGDGVQIISSESTENTIQGLTSVKAKNYAGGISGAVTTADAIGVLNNTLGIGSYLPFSVSNIHLSGDNLQIEASNKYASGGAGLMLGGTAFQIEITGLQSVTAGNYAGGFAGRAGTGSLAKEGGLDLLGLGLIKVNNLLSLVDGVATKISKVSVSGTENGAVIKASGQVEITEGESILAGGFISEAEGVEITDSSVINLKQVYAQDGKDKESYAGGFVGRSHTGGLAGLAQEDEDGALKLPGIVDVSGLLDLVPYLTPKYINTTVAFCLANEVPQVKADYAGGFFGEMQSGQVDNSELQEKYAVYGLEQIEGKSYAGGFAGKADAGALASSDGLKLLDGVLSINIGDLLNVLDVYIPVIISAGVKSSESGFTVEATNHDSSAGGYIGAGSGVRIKNCNVTSLKHTKVSPPGDGLESLHGDSYFNDQSDYAVKAGKYAGGYIGCADIDSAAAVGGGLKLLGDLLSLDNLLSAVDMVATIIENSNVTGAVGGFSVLANGKDSSGHIIGKAGGFAGENSGSRITNCNVENFEYIVGQEMAGGFVGQMEPGNVAAVLENADILNGLIDPNGSLASLVNAFIPIIEDSQTKAIPCGGVVRAQGVTDSSYSRGMAGGFAGYNHGGRIRGTNTECAVVRLRSVYGGEFAGGFTGLMENADLAGTGNISLLFGVLELGNVLSLLQAVYPTEKNTAVYGPLRNMDMDTWNKWAEAVGSEGVYGPQFPTTPVESQEELDELIKNYAYGYNVKSGRTETGSLAMQAGVSGGYVGRMQGGEITEAHAWDAKNVTAYRSTGGFAGEMLTGGVAEVGGVNLLGLDITGSINAVQTFVPVIKNSDITGYQSGLSVKSTGIPQRAGSDKVEKVGYAGGFVGHMTGGQIWGNQEVKKVTGRAATDAKPDPNNDRCFVANLRRVDGTNAVGGFAGLIDPGSAVALDTASSEGLLGGLLQGLIGSPGDLLSVLNATLSTVYAADVKAWDSYGITINGAYTDGSENTKYAKAAGGFAGELKGAIIGNTEDVQMGAHVENLRSVTGGEHARGFFGLADVSAVAEISGDGSTSILEDLLKLGSADVLDAFRTYIYHSSVSGTEKSGAEVRARDGKETEYVNDPVYTGNAGGFGGTLLNGSVKESEVKNLREVNGLNYAGGFIGHLGKSGIVDLDELGVFGELLGVGAGVLDTFGSHVENSKVTGVNGGFTVTSKNTVNQKQKSEIAGGFAGFADLAKLDNNTVTNLKQVASEEIAGDFAGRTSFAYLAEIKADSWLVNQLITLLDKILQALWLEDLQEGNVIRINLGLITVDALYDGDLIHLNLLGLDISIALAKDKQLATIYIGDSKIEINCGNDGSIADSNEDLNNEINISLIKANRTRIRECTVTGIPEGYDVYGGGAGNDKNGSGKLGIAGGFVGLNNEGLLQKNQMTFADVVRGSKDLTGPFTGKTNLDSKWDFNTVFGIEGEGNRYRVYRESDAAYDKLVGRGNQELQSEFQSNEEWNIYTITHMTENKVEQFADLKDAKLSNGTVQKEANIYMEDGAMAVLMNNTPTEVTPPDGSEVEPPDIQDPCKDTVELKVKKIWKDDSEKERPEQITLHITRSYKDTDGKERMDESFGQEVVLNRSDYQSENVWEKILSGPEYTAYKEIDGQKYYYTYYVSEDTLDGYTTKIEYQGDYHYSMTITNEKRWFDKLLPETGGTGTTLIYTIGILLLLSVAVMEYRKRKREKMRNIYK